MFKLMLFVIKLTFNIIFFPFILLFGKPAPKKNSKSNDDFEEGLIMGSIFFDDWDQEEEI